MSWSPTEGFSLPLDREQVRVVVAELKLILLHQCERADVAIRLPGDLDASDLLEELGKFKVWFDPTAKGARLRSELAKLDAVGRAGVAMPPQAALELGGGRRLMTPEGYVLLWVLRGSPPGLESLAKADLDAAGAALLVLYRRWSRRRLEDVVGLLNSETSTLRPAAAGLLLTLLVNRNTSPDRALTRPRQTEALEQVAKSIASPALAYASTLGGRTTSPSSVDLYRGWALGELRRRLGPGFHSNFAEGIWLDESTTQLAETRLIEDVQRRDTKGRARVSQALDAAMAAYERERPKLAALNLAFEQPGNSSRLRKALERAATTQSCEP